MQELSKHKTLNGTVLVEKINEEKKTASGIIIAEKETRGRLVKGKVVKVNTDEVPVKEGDTVYFRNGIGIEVILDTKPYLLLKGVELQLVEEA
jgi:co-chaperonin GroES (HSP10)